MRIPTPGIGAMDPLGVPMAGGGAPLVGIVLRESKTRTQRTWIPGLKYDVLVVDSWHTLYAVPVAIGGGGRGTLDVTRLEVADPTKVAEFQQSRAGGRADLDAGALGGSWVLVSFLADGLPIITGCITAPRTRASKVPDTASEPGGDEVSGTNAIDEIVESGDYEAWLRDADRLPDSLLQARTAPPPLEAFGADLEAVWSETWRAAWGNGARNGYWGAARASYADPTDDEAVLATDPATLGGDDADGETADVDAEVAACARKAYLQGFRAGDAAGRREAASRSTAPEPTQTVETESPEVETDDPADSDGDGGAVGATASAAKRYIEVAGARLVLRTDGTLLLDTRSSGKPIYIQAGDGGVRLVANGTSFALANGDKRAVQTADAVDVEAPEVNLGPKDQATYNPPTWQDLKAIEQRHNETLLALNNVILALETALNTISGGAGTAMLAAAQYVPGDVAVDLAATGVDIIQDKPKSTVISMAKTAQA